MESLLLVLQYSHPLDKMAMTPELAAFQPAKYAVEG